MTARDENREEGKEEVRREGRRDCDVETIDKTLAITREKNGRAGEVRRLYLEFVKVYNPLSALLITLGFTRG